MYHNNPDIIDALRQRIMALDFSWENTIERYFNVYRRVGATIEPAFIISEAEEKAVETTSPTAKKPRKQAVKENLPAATQTKEETLTTESIPTGQEAQIKEENPTAASISTSQEVMAQEKNEKKSAARIPSEKKTGSKKISKEVLPETSSLPQPAARKKSPAKK